MSEHEKQQIETAILRALYGAWAEQGDVSLDTVLEEGKWDKSLFWTVVERMEKRDRLITAQGSWSIYELTPSGVLYAEQKGAPPAEEVERHQMARTEILACLADLYEREGVDADYHYSEICDSTGLDMEIALLNLTFLKDVGYVLDTSSSSFRITHQGLEGVSKWKQRKELGEEFERIETLAPHPRGRALQKLLAKAIEQSGWLQEESVRTSHEEMDVIIYRDREYYLVECKWVADPVEAAGRPRAEGEARQPRGRARDRRLDGGFQRRRGRPSRRVRRAARDHPVRPRGRARPGKSGAFLRGAAQ